MRNDDAAMVSKRYFFRAEELGGERGDLGLGGEQGAREQYNR